MRLLASFLLTICACSAAELKLGQPLTLKDATAVDALLAAPDRFTNQTVLVKGKVTEVCQNMGCWMNLSGADGKMVRIKVKDGDIVFPQEAIGKTALAEGKLVKIEMTREQAIAQAKHEAEENGRKFDPATIKSGKTVYQIQGTGAVVLDSK